MTKAIHSPWQQIATILETHENALAPPFVQKANGINPDPALEAIANQFKLQCHIEDYEAAAYLLVKLNRLSAGFSNVVSALMPYKSSYYWEESNDAKNFQDLFIEALECQEKSAQILLQFMMKPELAPYAIKAFGRRNYLQIIRTTLMGEQDNDIQIVARGMDLPAWQIAAAPFFPSIAVAAKMYAGYKPARTVPTDFLLDGMMLDLARHAPAPNTVPALAY